MSCEVDGLIEHLPEIHDLFVIYNSQYFENALGSVVLEWSDRLTLCAGLCYKQRRDSPCTIRLSRPLLQYRPFTDTINTLLHEMIHAYLFIIQGGSLDRDGHGSDFQQIMNFINGSAGTSITVYHTFHAEVQELRKHVWKCNGKCQERPPFFGIVRRAINRPPQPADWWFNQHSLECGGEFIKISGEVKLGKVKSTKIGKNSLKHVKNIRSIREYFPPVANESQSSANSKSNCAIEPEIIDLTDV